MKILFINGSPEKNGNTAALAASLLKGKEYETLNLTDYQIGSYGQQLPGDQLKEVIRKIKESEILVIGSPLYWHNLCGSIRNMLDRFYGLVEEGELSGRTLYFYSREQRRNPDDGSRRVYHETICRTLWNEICRNGDK